MNLHTDCGLCILTVGTLVPPSQQKTRYSRCTPSSLLHGSPWMPCGSCVIHVANYVCFSGWFHGCRCCIAYYLLDTETLIPLVFTLPLVLWLHSYHWYYFWSHNWASHCFPIILYSGIPWWFWQQFKTSEMAQKPKDLAAKPGTWISFCGPTWWKEDSDLHPAFLTC